MKTPTDIRHAEELLREAMELLEDTYHNLGMFERQRYGKLKKQVDQHEALSETMKTALNVIDTQ
ncbi:hypothetical protein SAMN05216464_103186 [Mucilaginibacter pineti]|uniref:Uncharacterized protein n=1 Tax=Mucilaginibacter pineti TaxID=1391627 RepID=A0A1G6Z273_9SPHI|nr:hypothetical protein [Mucilaginibacter pineti]SDD96641.1 hypothetical protein SAMN05216464_103186 [Mucilaginibacter pineti]